MELIYLLYLFMVCAVVFWIYTLFRVIKEEKEATNAFIENHKKLRAGMSKKQVIQIMGGNYTQSILKNGVEKLEWKHRRMGFTGRVARGAYVHTGSLTRQISVKFKNNIVIEVNCRNMD